MKNRKFYVFILSLLFINIMTIFASQLFSSEIQVIPEHEVENIGIPEENLVINPSSFDYPPLWTFNAGAGDCGVAISEDGQYIVAAKGDTIFMFHNSSSEPDWNFTLSSDISGLDMTADGSNFVVIAAKNLYYFSRTNPLPSWVSPAPSPFQCVAISSNGQYIVAGTGFNDNIIFLYDSSDPEPLWNHTIGGLSDSNVWSVDISSNPVHIVAGTIKRMNQIMINIIHKNISS